MTKFFNIFNITNLKSQYILLLNHTTSIWHIFIVIDMQNDFIDGSLGTDEAVKIVPNVQRAVFCPRECLDNLPREYPL